MVGGNDDDDRRLWRHHAGHGRGSGHQAGGYGEIDAGEDELLHALREVSARLARIEATIEARR